MRSIRLAIVALLNGLCVLIDSVLYRPAVVLMGRRLPRWWNCELGKLAVRLDERWNLGYMDFLVPGPPCAACGRRASTVYFGGWALEPDYEPDPDDDDFYLARRRIEICQWCMLYIKHSGTIENEDELQETLRSAAAQSVSWRWRWKPPSVED